MFRSIRQIRVLVSRQTREAWLLILPYTLHLAVFVLFPVLFSVWLTFHRWNIISPMEWNHYDNYIHLLQDRVFLKSLMNTLYFLLIHIPLQVLIALVLAVFLVDQPWLRGFFRSTFFLPVVISGVVITILWQQLLGLETGIFNRILLWAGGYRLEWLSDPRIAMLSVAMMATWKNVGLYVILFLTGIQQVPVALYEAAKMEGANGWQQFRFITFPAIRPTMLMVSILSTIGGFSLFIEPYVMTDGGPINSTMSTVLYMYKQAFGYYHMGYAATLGLVFAFLVMVVVGVQKRIFEHEES